MGGVGYMKEKEQQEDGRSWLYNRSFLCVYF